MVIVDREASWGGQWVRQYDFVRLHQPYKVFTAGERVWNLSKPQEHLAKKKEILAHFEDIVSDCVRERRLDLVGLFEFEYVSHVAHDGDATVTIKARSSRGELPDVVIIASKLIKAQ
eukprot:SAG11_NODE_2655_length_3123_cov_1.476852_4_plen_117_part_00